MTKEREALKLALEALGAYLCATDDDEDVKAHNLMAEAFFKLKEVLAQPEPGGVCVRCGGWVCDPIPELAQPEARDTIQSVDSSTERKAD